MTLLDTHCPPQHAIMGSHARAVARTLDAIGIDSATLFATAGINRELGNDPMSRLPAEAVTRLYRACVEASGDPYFGLAVARHASLANMHALGQGLAVSATLDDFCHRLERYVGLVSKVVRVRAEQSGDAYSLHFDPLGEVCGQSEDFFLGFLVLAMRQLHAPGFKPQRVEFHHAAPVDGGAPYAALFAAPVSYGHASARLVFDRAAMRAPLHGACAELAQVNDQIAVAYLAKLDRDDVIAGTRQKIVELLADGNCSRERVAAALRLSPSLLHTRLTQRGTHFQQLLDSTRKELAYGYLSQSQRSVTEVTFLLGFSDAGNFTRAFRRWAGVSPSEFRQGFQLAGMQA